MYFLFLISNSNSEKLLHKIFVLNFSVPFAEIAEIAEIAENTEKGEKR